MKITSFNPFYFVALIIAIICVANGSVNWQTVMLIILFGIEVNFKF